MAQAPTSKIVETITGNSSRQPVKGALRFDDVKLSDSAQKSHIIPQQSYKKITDLFGEIEKAKLPQRSGDIILNSRPWPLRSPRRW